MNDRRLEQRKRERLAERHSKPPELVVISPVRDWTCAACEGTGELLIMEEPGPLCLACADMDHLVFLAAGDAALTRRAKAASTLSAVVVRFSRARKRYERQGILVEEDALAAAELQASARRMIWLRSITVLDRRRSRSAAAPRRRASDGRGRVVRGLRGIAARAGCRSQAPRVAPGG